MEKLEGEIFIHGEMEGEIFLHTFLQGEIFLHGEIGGINIYPCVDELELRNFLTFLGSVSAKIRILGKKLLISAP